MREEEIKGGPNLPEPEDEPITLQPKNKATIRNHWWL